MATYLFRDANKAAFINGVNSLFSKNKLTNLVSDSDLLDTPPNKQEFTLFVTEDPQEISVIDQAIEDKHFGFAIKNVDLTKMIRESKKKNRK
jgi:hypothetical protein